MYQWLWSLLPGPRWVKVSLAVIIAAVIFLLLMEIVFPWVSAQMPYSDVTV